MMCFMIYLLINFFMQPFDCKYCDKKFREKGTLIRHIRYASVQCLECSSSRNNVLCKSNNNSTHTGEKPYACNICGTSYAAR